MPFLNINKLQNARVEVRLVLDSARELSGKEAEREARASTFPGVSAYMDLMNNGNITIGITSPNPPSYLKSQYNIPTSKLISRRQLSNTLNYIAYRSKTVTFVFFSILSELIQLKGCIRYIIFTRAPPNH